MTYRADLQTPPRHRFLSALPITTLCCWLLGGTASRVGAQAAPVPVDPQVPAAAAAAPPAVVADAPPIVVPQPETSLLVIVRSTDNGAPAVPFAAVRVDSETERARSRTSNTDGNALFTRIPDGTYTITVTALQRATGHLANVVIPAGTRTTVTVFLSPLGALNIVGISTVDLLDHNDYSISYTRDRSFMRDFPLNAGNRQDLSRLLTSVPGIAYASGNRDIARGEDNVAASTTIDGTLAPPAAQGRAASLYLPSALTSFRAIVGNFAPEYTGSGMVLNLNVLPVPADRPEIDLEGSIGTDNTTEADVTFGTRAYPGRLGRKAATSGKRTFRGAPLAYVFSASQRFTDNSLESPQPDRQTVANFGESDLILGKLEMQLKNQLVLDALVNYSYGLTDIADRTGLSGAYIPTGQGFGFAGAFPAAGLASQARLGKDDRQKDSNLLTLVQLRKTTASGALINFAVGASESTLQIDGHSRFTQSISNLPLNSSVEYRPFVRNDYQLAQVQGDITLPPKPKSFHEYKFGGVYQDLVGLESYQLTTQSQFALDALHALDPRLAPGGGSLTGSYDVLGFPGYAVLGGAKPTATPVVSARRSGTYTAAYVQDTWKVRAPLTINYGFRFDAYGQTVITEGINPQLGTISNRGVVPRVSTSSFSPRVNGILTFPQGGRIRFLSSAPTVARFGYNRLFAAPGMGQGNIIGNQAAEGAGGTQRGQPAQPQTTDQYDVNIERQFGVRAIGRVGFYSKTIKNYLQTEQLIPGLQADTLAIFNQGNAVSDGADITFEVGPARIGSGKRVGLHAFLSLDDSLTHLTNGRQLNNLGHPIGGVFNAGYFGGVAPYLEGDQTDTLAFGIASNRPNGSLIGLSGYYGTGLYSSALRAIQVPARLNATRQSYSEINLRFSTGPRFLRKTSSILVEVSNLFDSRERIDYFGAFGGTRFQQGRRVMLTFNGRL